jgi:hypothetical protein
MTAQCPHFFIRHRAIQQALPVTDNFKQRPYSCQMIICSIYKADFLPPPIGPPIAFFMGTLCCAGAMPCLPGVPHTIAIEINLFEKNAGRTREKRPPINRHAGLRTARLDFWVYFLRVRQKFKACHARISCYNCMQ